MARSSVTDLREPVHLAPRPRQAAEPVYLVTFVSGMDGNVIRLLGGQRPAGFVLAAAGSGNTHPDFQAAALEQQAAGVKIVLTTRCAFGNVEPIYAFPGGGATWARAGVMLSRLARSQGARRAGLGAGRAGAGETTSAPSSERDFAGRPDHRRPRRDARGRLVAGAGPRAIAVAGGRIVGVGGSADLDGLAGPATERWRLPSDTLVMPAITDAHLHLISLLLARDTARPDRHARPGRDAAGVGRRTTQTAGGGRHGWLAHRPRLVAARARSVARPRDAGARCARPAGRAVRARPSHALGQPPGAGAGRRSGADRATLPAVAAAGRGRPANRDPARGRGWRWSTRRFPIRPTTDLERELAAQAAELFALGHDRLPRSGRADQRDRDIRARAAVLPRPGRAEGRLPLRVHSSIRAPAGPCDRAGPAQRRGRSAATGWAGSSSSPTARSARAAPPCSSRTRTRRERRRPAARRAWSSPTPRSSRQLLDAGGSGGHQRPGARDRRWRGQDRARRVEAACRGPTRCRRAIEHAQLVDPADVPRFGALGVAASVQPVHLRSDAEPQREAWGERADNTFPLRALIAGGALIPFGTDAPVEPPDPWPGIAVAVARRDPSRPADDADRARRGDRPCSCRPRRVSRSGAGGSPARARQAGAWLSGGPDRRAGRRVPREL